MDRQGTAAFTWIQVLLVLNIGMFLLEMVYGAPLIDALALWPLQSSHLAVAASQEHPFRLWQLLTYAFLHGSPMHLLLNMYGLWLFGSRMERVWGSPAFGQYYFICVVGAGLVQLVIATLGAAKGAAYPTVGASGGIFGLLLAFGLTFPNERLMLLFPPVVLRAKWFVLIYGLIELWSGFTGTAAGVAHFAHLGGMLFGYLVLRYWRHHPPGYG
jgi:membrane associated rhomboid family serine protease